MNRYQKYNRTEKGRRRANKYNVSDKGRARDRRYSRSPRGRLRDMRQSTPFGALYFNVKDGYEQPVDPSG